MIYIRKIIVFEFDDLDNRLYEKVITLLKNEQNETTTVQLDSPAILTFEELEIRLHQHRVLRNGKDIPLTRLEYGTLVYLASSPGRVFTQTQIFEAVWHMDSNSCHSSVVNTIYNLRKKLNRIRKILLT